MEEFSLYSPLGTSKKRALFYVSFYPAGRHLNGPWPNPNFFQGSEKRGRGRPRKSSNSSAKRRAVTSPKYGGVKGQQSATSSTLVARSTPKKGKSKGKGPSGSNGSLELQGGPYLGKRIAQDFPRFGVFTGEVVEAKAKGTKDTLFNVM